MDKVQFIAAKDLPVAEGKDVNALCVENGELKQKPMSGGAGGYVIRVKPEWMSEDSTNEEMKFNADISYDEIAELLYNGGSVVLDMSEVVGMFTMIHALMVMQMDETVYSLASTMNGNTIMVTFPAGTWQPPTIE